MQEAQIMNDIAVRGRINVFGEISAQVSGGSQIVLPGTRTQELLAALSAEANASIRRDRLIEWIWPESNERNGRKALNTELWRLRKSIKHAGGEPEDWISSTAEALKLRTDSGIIVDLQEFRNELSRASNDPQHLISVTKLYRGDFAEGITTDWALQERSSIRRTFLRLLHKVITNLRRVNQLADALVFAERLCREEPFDEAAHRSLILVHIQLGDRSAAARHYQDFESNLQLELGVSPAPETQKLFRICQDGGSIEDIDGTDSSSYNAASDRAYAIEALPTTTPTLNSAQSARRRLMKIENATQELLRMIQELETELRSMDF